MSFPLGGRYVVLGSTGLVGSHALGLLAEKTGVRVRAVYHHKKPFIRASNIEYFQADLLDPRQCREALKGADYVLHLAGILSTSAAIAKNPLQPMMETLVMSVQCMEAAHESGVKKFLWLSSSTGYPSSDKPLKEEEMFLSDPPDVWYPVGWMSRYLEILSRMYSEKIQKPMLTLVLRPSLIYGEYDNFSFESGHFLPVLMRKVLEKQDPLPVLGKGEEMRDVIYASDVAEAALVSLERLECHEVMNIAYGKSYTINELLANIIRIHGSNPRVVHSDAKPHAVASRMFDIQKAKKLIGFTPKVSVDQGLRKTMTWYQDRNVRK